MVGTVRGAFTLVGAGVAGLLVWVSTQIGEGTTGGYWAVYGILAGAGLTMALSQIVGGWTKWGFPRVSMGVFLIGFLPTLVAAGWVLLAKQPDANWFERHITSWSGHAGIGGLVNDVGQYLGVLAFGLRLVFGLTFDTAGPVVAAEPEPVAEPVERPAMTETREPVPGATYEPVAPTPQDRVREEQPVR